MSSLVVVFSTAATAEIDNMKIRVTKNNFTLLLNITLTPSNICSYIILSHFSYKKLLILKKSIIKLNFEKISTKTIINKIKKLK